MNTHVELTGFVAPESKDYSHWIPTRAFLPYFVADYLRQQSVHVDDDHCYGCIVAGGCGGGDGF